MTNDKDLPDSGVVFWPVGNGDSTTLLIGDDQRTVIQIDLNHLEAADTEVDDREHVIDRLVPLLPEGDDGRPYLSAFVLTHPDVDHCRGFPELLDRVTIGELWATPRIFRAQDELSAEAKTFEEEALRRVGRCIDAGGDPGPGDRLRLIGYEDIANEATYAGFPDSMRSAPGTEVTTVDERDLTGVFRAFVHAPFKDDLEDGDRNDTSLALQVTVGGDAGLRVLLLGDLAFPTIDNILARSDQEDLRWDVLLAPHHCSHRAFVTDDGDEHSELADRFAETMEAGAHVIASSKEFPTDDSGPPHRDARAFYERIVGVESFLATSEHTGPITFDDLGVPHVERAAVGATGRLGRTSDPSRRGNVPPPRHSERYGSS